jgi:hypothetical protein
MMDPAIKADWLKALRSGDYNQTQGILTNVYGYCCLGVLCEVQNTDIALYYPGNDKETSMLHEQDRAGLTPEEMGALADMNDAGMSFADIANHIEETL